MNRGLARSTDWSPVGSPGLPKEISVYVSTSVHGSYDPILSIDKKQGQRYTLVQRFTDGLTSFYIINQNSSRHICKHNYIIVKTLTRRGVSVKGTVGDPPAHSKQNS